MQLTNVKISEAKKVKEGEGEHGHWELWSLTIDGKKYSKFKNKEDMLNPGTELALVEYEEKKTEKNGKQYTNFSITKMVLSEKPNPTETSQGQPCNNNRDMSFWVAYCKDIQCQRIAVSPVLADTSLKDHVSEVVIAAKQMAAALNGQEKPKSKDPWDDDPGPSGD
jgi:hypothetical protein